VRRTLPLALTLTLTPNPDPDPDPNPDPDPDPDPGPRYAWEQTIGSKLAEVRAKELRLVRRQRFMSAFLSVFMTTQPLFLTVSTFSVYAASGRPLEVRVRVRVRARVRLRVTVRVRIRLRIRLRLSQP